MSDEYKLWVCTKCGHEVMSSTNPTPMKWTDGHVCYFREEKKKWVPK